MAPGIVVVFDFDKTIIDVDSDNWVVDELGFTGLFDQLLHTMPWNSLMVSTLIHFQRVILYAQHISLVCGPITLIVRLDIYVYSDINGVLNSNLLYYLQDRMMKEIHASGKTIGDIERVLRGIPIHPRIVPAIKAAHSLG